MTTANVSQPTTTSQSQTFDHALLRAASLYAGHVDQARLDKAVAIAQTHAITCHADGTATVQGPERTHHVNGVCDCDDTTYHDTYCKHYLAVELTKIAQHHRTAQERTAPASPTPSEPHAPWQCAQAPSSCTLKWEVGGIELLLTLRDSTDHQLFTRIGAILPRLKDTVAAERQQRRDAAQKRKEDEAAAAQATTTEDTAATPRQAPEPDDDNAEHFCVHHDVPFTRKSKGNHVWYSHWDDVSAAWCRERR